MLEPATTESAVVQTAQSAVVEKVAPSVLLLFLVSQLPLPPLLRSWSQPLSLGLGAGLLPEGEQLEEMVVIKSS